MKKQSNTLFSSLSTEVMTNLTKEIKETIAIGLALPMRKIFTTVDLWNIHRQVKARVQRRYL